MRAEAIREGWVDKDVDSVDNSSANTFPQMEIGSISGRRVIELRNQADSFVYQAEKNLKEYGDKVDASEREKIQTAIDGVKSVQNGSDAGAIRSAIETLQQAMMKLGEVMYQQTAGGAGGPGPEGAQPGTGSAGGPQSGSAGGPVDAEFTVEDDDRKNS